MDKFLERLYSGGTLVADGATGTNLHGAGLVGGKHPEDWVFEEPQKILALEKAFVEAGSDIILTCTFGATRPRLKGTKYADRVMEVNKQAAQLACEAASKRPGVFVAGSIGPTGLLMRPYGPLGLKEAVAAFAEQAEGLVMGGVDFLVIESQFATDEADAAFEGTRSVTDLPIVVSFSYDRGVRTMMGVKPSNVVKRYKAMGASLVGANCGTTLENLEAVMSEYGTAEAGFPLWAKPNAGIPHLEGAQTVHDVTPERMGEFARKYVELGARVVGGCCGSTPEHVAAIARAVR